MENSNSNSANSAKQTGQDTQTGGNSHDNSRAREKKSQRRAIDAVTISEIARLTARLLSESQACRKIGINPRTWFNWKSRNRNGERFGELLEAFRANRIDDLITKIENAADGIGMKQPDWRSAAFLLSVTDKRFNPSAPAQEPPRLPPLSVTVVLDSAMKVYAELAAKTTKAAHAIDLPAETRQLQDAPTKLPPIFPEQDHE